MYIIPIKMKSGGFLDPPLAPCSLQAGLFLQVGILGDAEHLADGIIHPQTGRHDVTETRSGAIDAARFAPRRLPRSFQKYPKGKTGLGLARENSTTGYYLTEWSQFSQGNRRS